MSDANDDLLTRAAQARREGRFGDAKRDLVDAISALRKQPAGAGLARALRVLGEVERRLHNSTAAREHYEEAVAHYRSGDDILALAHTIRHLGDVHHDAGRSELAEPCYREALELYRSQPHSPALDVANAIRSMALLKSEAGELAQARMLWEEARGLYEQGQIAEGVAECSQRLARLAG
jgi:tetratricopeptide (TPR) repeat protein